MENDKQWESKELFQMNIFFIYFLCTKLYTLLLPHNANNIAVIFVMKSTDLSEKYMFL